MKKLAMALTLIVLLLTACSSGKYTEKIDKAVKMQDDKQERLAKHDQGDVVKHFDKKDANIYVFEHGKYVILGYKQLSDNDEIHYYAYQFSGKTISFKENFDAKGYIQKHDPDYKEENMN
ncbi:DUF4467 domain-containing protein [Staphylococcus lugdunensis]|uniref:DUF4467 domain-containing protein n=1 Tax=Staphylococcus lugdunensis TaxID=28035 RepID=UPI0003098415|nr:DUF4467 domain-containing protein [Staphylococcus lugdunensis]SQE70970.1 putative lipoprotein [Staphylococcus lugdunensis]